MWFTLLSNHLIGFSEEPIVLWVNCWKLRKWIWQILLWTTTMKKKRKFHDEFFNQIWLGRWNYFVVTRKTSSNTVVRHWNHSFKMKKTVEHKIETSTKDALFLTMHATVLLWIALIWIYFKIRKELDRTSRWIRKLSKIFSRLSVRIFAWSFTKQLLFSWKKLDISRRRDRKKNSHQQP